MAPFNQSIKHKLSYRQALLFLYEAEQLCTLVLQRKLKITYEKAYDICNALAHLPGVTATYSERGIVLKRISNEKIIKVDFCKQKYISQKINLLGRQFIKGEQTRQRFNELPKKISCL